MKNEIKSLASALVRDLDRASEQLRTIERYRFDQLYGQEDQYFPVEFELGKFEYQLKSLFRLLSFSFEAAGFASTREEFINGWQEFKDELSATQLVHEVDVLNSEPLGYLGEYVFALKIFAFGHENPFQDCQKDRLESMLKSTAVLLRRRGTEPKSEADIQRVMDDYLLAAFSDYVKHPIIPGFIKNFKPDGGIKSINAAIEYKFVTTGEELKTALSGIFEDISGYKASLDWNKFYSVIYMTEPFEAEPRLHEELKRVGAFDWKIIPVFGGGTKKKTDVSKLPKAKSKH